MKTLLGCSKSIIITGLSKETRKIPNKQPHSISQRSTKRRTKAAQSQQKNRRKIRAELSEIENKKDYTKN